jgi:hypothetical protein
MPRPLYRKENTLGTFVTQMCMRSGELQWGLDRSGCCDEDKNFLPVPSIQLIQLLLLDGPARSSLAGAGPRLGEPIDIVADACMNCLGLCPDSEQLEP